jgi:hypothetical protein
MTVTCELGHAVPPLPPGPFTTNQCRRCWLLAGGDWGAPPPPPPLPPMPRALPCVHEGAVLTFCPLGDELKHVRDCDRHGEITRARCEACPDYQPDGYQVQTSGNGVGDAVSAYLACCGLADATGEHVTFRSKHDHGWFAGCSHPLVHITLQPGAGVDCNTDYEGQLHACAARTCPSVQHWYTAQLARHLNLPPFPPSRPKAVTKPAPVLDPGYVVLSPFSLHSSREWPVGRWQELAARLAADGRRVVGIDGAGDGSRLAAAFGSTPAVWYWGQTPAWVAALIAHADAFAGNDSGMAHVAALHGTPAAVVHTHLAGFVFGDPALNPSVREVTSDWGCVGCGWKRACPTPGRCGALDGIPAEKALVALGTPERPVDVDRIVREKLGQRAATTEWLFAELRSRWSHPRVVETGCVRSPDDWSAGYFTWLCGAVLDAHGGELVSVDNDPAHCATARRLCGRWSRVSVVQSDSVAYLRDRTEPIDLLYLDSMDTYVAGHAEHGLAEAQAGARLVSERGLIAFDDTPAVKGVWVGKGAFAVPWLVSNGWRVVPASGYQTVLERG